MSSREPGIVAARPAAEEIAPVLVWHPRAEEYRRALLSRLPGVPIDAHGGGCHAALPSDARALLAWRLPPQALLQVPELRWLQVAGAGVDHVLGRDDLPDEVIVTRSLGRFGVQVAEYVLAYLLHLWVGIEEYRRDQDRAVWSPRPRPLLADARVGLVGLGSIGTEVAHALHALGACVLGVCRSGRPRPHVARVFPAAEWQRMLPECDALVLTAPLTAETRGMVDAAALKLLPRGAVLVNVGRGGLVREEALLAALREGHLRAAVLDVFDEEPLPAEHPLWTEPGAWITPHVAAPSEIEPIADEFAANYWRFVNGERLHNIVDRRRGY